MNKTIASILIPMLTIFAAQTSAVDPFGSAVKKKIIEFSWDNPTPEYLARNLELIETYVPHDGLGIDISKVITLPNGKKTLNNWHNFTKIRFRREWYVKDIEHLKKVHAKARHLKYNFINTSASSFTGEFDLFDDEFWDAVCEKFTIFAWVAKQGGCTGIRFDLEDYGNQQVWRYRPSCGHSWAEAWDKARQRGRQWMTAVTKEYPDITVFCFFWLDLMMGYADGLPDLYGRLESCGTGLLVAFINGIYDVLPPNAKIVDGMEAHGYGAYELNSYNRMRAFREQRFPQLLSPENRIKFLKQGSFACATFMDAYLIEKGKFADYRKEKKMTMLELFRRNFTWSVQYSDEYVWTWSESRKWFPCRFPHAWQEKSLAKYPKLPGPYMGMAIPGVEDAISYARDPWNYTLGRLKDPGALKNLLKNPDFESTAAAKAVLTAAPGSVMIKKLPCWETWQHKKSKGSFSLAEGKGIGGNALLIRNVSHGCAHQSVKIDPNSAYIVRASAKLFGRCGASLSVQWRNAQGKWCDHAMNVATSFSEDLGNGWKRATLVIRNVPENARYLSVMLNSYAGGSYDSVLFDNAEVFSMFEKEPSAAPHLKDAMEKWRKMTVNKQKKGK